MDDTTKTMMLTLASGIIKKGLITLGTAAATHGIISSNQTETFVAVGLALAGAGWSFWNDYGKAIVLSQLEVLKARSLASAKKIQEAGLKSVTVAEIAAQSPDAYRGQCYQGCRHSCARSESLGHSKGHCCARYHANRYCPDK